MRSSNVLIGSLVCAVGLAACGPEFAVVPRGGMDRAVAQSAGAAMVAFANQWGGDPNDLADYVTPIAVELYNGSPYEVRVNYADLALRDGSGSRYQAINPFVSAAMVSEKETIPVEKMGELTAVEKTVTLAADGTLLVAYHGGGGGSHGGGMSSGGFHGSSMSSGAVRGGSSRGPRVPGGRLSAPTIGARGGWGWRGGGWRGYRPIGGLRGWYGYGVGYWGGPWAMLPYYNDWVIGWYPYYRSAPSQDVLELGLPEGVLPPGARVSGFLYFKRATGQNQGSLELSWEMHEANNGAPLGSLRLPLEVVHR